MSDAGDADLIGAELKRLAETSDYWSRLLVAHEQRSAERAAEVRASERKRRVRAVTYAMGPRRERVGFD